MSGPNTSPTVGEDDIRIFTNGGCYVLARTLSRATGWPIVAYGEGGNIELVTPYAHAWVMTPSGSALDIRGPQSPADHDDYWSEWVDDLEWHTFQPSEFSDEWNRWGRPPSVHKRASELSQYLIEQAWI